MRSVTLSSCLLSNRGLAPPVRTAEIGHAQILPADLFARLLNG